MNQPGTFRIMLADWWRDADAIRQLRTTVFIVEQGIPAALEWDGQDADCDHVLVEDAAGQSLATGRLMPDGRIGRMAVRADWRRQGVGSLLLQALLDQARHRGLHEVYLHAQQAVSRFYRKADFLQRGDPFLEAGIMHVVMQRTL
jgi:predicted GNAT family N-acyltransferase